MITTQLMRRFMSAPPPVALASYTLKANEYVDIGIINHDTGGTAYWWDSDGTSATAGLIRVNAPDGNQTFISSQNNGQKPVICSISGSTKTRFSTTLSGGRAIPMVNGSTTIYYNGRSNASAGVPGMQIMQAISANNGSNYNNALWAFGISSSQNSNNKCYWNFGNQPYSFYGTYWIVGDNAGNSPLITIAYITVVRVDTQTRRNYTPYQIGSKVWFCSTVDMSDRFPVVSV